MHRPVFPGTGKNRKFAQVPADVNTSVPLNVFQRLARMWERVHPYNAAQAMKLAGTIDPARAQRAWSASLDATGLGRVRVKGTLFQHELLNGEMVRYPLRVLPGGTVLADYLSAELNRAFDDPNEPPFRPFVLQAPDGCYLGVVYQHWVADSASIRLLLRAWYARLSDAPQAGSSPLRQPRAGYWRLFGPGRTGWHAGATALSLFRRHMRYRRARKVKTFGADDYPLRLLLRDAPDGLIDRLRERARAQACRVNDVFVAAAADVCSRCVPTQRRRNRRDIAVGSIVDLRPYAGTDLSATFGLFLGFTEVVCRPAELRDFSRLLRSVAHQNHQHRRLGIAQSSLAWLGAAVTAGRFVSPDDMYHFYRKETPLLGGVSNVNLNGTWAADGHAHGEPALLQYLRVSPTGPLVPLVFTLTTLGSRLHLSLTYRPALLDESGARAMADAFLARLTAFAGLDAPPHDDLGCAESGAIAVDNPSRAGNA